MSVQTAETTVSGAASDATVFGEIATYRTKVSSWFGGLGRQGTTVIGWIWILYLFFLQELHEIFTVFGTVIVGTFSLALILIFDAFNTVMEFGQLLRHHKVSMWIFMKIVLLESFQRFADTSLACDLVKHPLLVNIPNTIRFTSSAHLEH